MTSTRRSKFFITGFSGLALLAAQLQAQKSLSGAAEIKESIERLNVVGSVLMIAAHPDDENTAVLAYFARGMKLETGYLSLTRGEGGQNFIGSQQGEKLGVIRTEELLAARRIDGAQQFFSRAIDFGFTKTPEEAMAKWGRDSTLSDIVWTIRAFRPDVIILRFSGTPRDGHGQHQASAILGREAFSAAADPSRFPEQLKEVEPWQAKRLMWNVFAFTPEQEREMNAMKGRVEIDAGDFNPVLGYSYGEIAGMSRSMHRSQAMGAPERRGSMKQSFVTVAGDTAVHDLFDGIDLTWSRTAGGEQTAALVAQADQAFKPEHPEQSIPALAKARQLVAANRNPWAQRKLPEFDEAIALCAGIWVDASAERPTAAPGSQLKLTLTALNRGRAGVRLRQVTWNGSAAGKPNPVSLDQNLSYNTPLARPVSWEIAADQPNTQPYWLISPRSNEAYSIASQNLVGRPENPPLLEARFALEVGGVEVTLARPVVYRFIDRARGELMRPLAIVPPVSISMPENALVFVNGAQRRIEVPVRSQSGPAEGSLQLSPPPTWRIDPPQADFKVGAGEQRVLRFTVTPPSGSDDVRAEISASAKVNGRPVTSEVDVIDYEHIPAQTLFPKAQSIVAAATIKNLATHIGYIMGSGDEVPSSLRQIGCEVAMLSADDLARLDLTHFDAIVTGVRAWNVRPDLPVNRQRLLDYVRNGGTLVVQYNVLEGGFMGGDPKLLDGIGPYPIGISRERVTVEDVPVQFPNA